MNINSVQYNSYLASIAQSQTISTKETEVQTGNTESDKDSYIPSLASADMVIPSGTYNSNGLEVGTSSNATNDEAATSQGGAGGVGGGGSSSDSEEDTETEVVTINGVTYLQTTTTDANGNTTVTRTQIGSAPVDNN